MLRGSQKQMIVVRTRNSRMFEEAYFVMRRGAGRDIADEADMLWEANRIIESSLPREPERFSPLVADEAEADLPGRKFAGKWRQVLCFVGGLLAGGGLVGGAWLMWLF